MSYIASWARIAMRDLLLEQLQFKFGSLSPDFVQRFENEPAKKLKLYAFAILTANQPEDIFKAEEELEKREAKKAICKLLFELLKSRFGPIPQDFIQQLEFVPTEKLEKYIITILQAENELEDFEEKFEDPENEDEDEDSDEFEDSEKFEESDTLKESNELEDSGSEFEGNVS